MTDLEYRSLGRSGLRVSAVGLGGNNFGRPGTATETQEGTDAVVSAALEAGVNFIDTADIYGARVRAQRDAARRIAARPSRRGRHRDEVRPRDPAVAAALLGRTRLAALHPPGRRRVAAAPADRLDRPLPAAHPRPRDADRRDDRRPRRARARGEGALPRALEPQRLAGRRGGARRTRARGDAVRLGPERVQPPRRAAPRPRSCRRSATSDSGSCPSSRCTTAS